MRRSGIVSLAFSASLLAFGCGMSTPSSPGTNPKTSDADDKVRDAEKATLEAARAKRDEFVREMQQQFDVIDAKYKALEQRAADAKGDAKKGLDEKVKVAKAKRDHAAEKLGEVKAAGVERWEKVKEGVGNAFDDLKKVFE